MSTRPPQQYRNSTWGKLGLAAGAVACVLPLPLFGIKLPSLPAFEQGVLTAVFLASMTACSLVGSRRPLLGLIALAAGFFGVQCLACWWVAGRPPTP